MKECRFNRTLFCKVYISNLLIKFCHFRFFAVLTYMLCCWENWNVSPCCTM